MIKTNLALLQLMKELSAGEHTKSAITLRHLDIKQKLIMQDQTLQNVYIIKSGVIKCFMTEENEKDYILDFLGEGELLGEIEAIRHKTAGCTVEAITPLTVYALTSTQFRHFLETIPAFNMAVLEQLVNRVMRISEKASRHQLYTLAEILPQLLNTLESQQINFTKQDLSEYLGISVRSLNRMLKDTGHTAI
ncbi:Crp/Fnr family transcriptional regulator [Chitinophaga pinensis]|uniref:Transcriptional regulator, Crp/Fnr family n=1 Tax=Chitinophaga pinensis (strain ATCC 43595 / DSM 2588 / LMG 13176 / NBRC 15968 / NCIMB 11800 / UQM 2034) TaxID=485918 RepID=A0A979FZ46_CHIPD|nr:Crp/Fnr family transcriptional regulator [Chitinophaga pinensis]ACU57811.1 putative transcriptional regulator, Crp/Fnr family [Chitinophaga pinensis DSM 2588]